MDQNHRLFTLKGAKQAIFSIAFSPDNRWLATGNEDAAIFLWQLQTHQLLKTLLGHQQSVLTVVFSPDGQHLASGSEDKTIKIWR